MEIIFHPCLTCGKIIPKKIYESANRYINRKFCCNAHAKKYFSDNEIGWYSYGSNTIVKKNDKKSKEDDLPPLLMSDQELKEFYDSIPELANF